MRRFFLLMAVFTAASCIDKDYDLTQVNTDNTVIGDLVRFPLATVRIGMEELHGEADIEALFAEADIWLPATMPGNAEFLDMERIDDQSYTTPITEALTAQMLTDTKKLDQVARQICKKYKAEFLAALHLPANTSDEVFIATFKSEFPKQPALHSLASSYASKALRQIAVEEKQYQIEGVDISESVIKMLAGNLNSGASLHIYGSIVSRLPVSMRIELQFENSTLQLPATIDALQDASPIAEQPMSEQDLRLFVEGIRIRIPVDLLKYYPSRGFHPQEKDQVVISLHLIKRGGLLIQNA